MLEDVEQLRTLAAEYRQLADGPAIDPQRRGQRLNSLVAEVLRVYGISATSDENERGNIDVAFSVDGRRFILEAKWEQEPTGTGAIAKLTKRVRQRLAGTIGIVLSVNGYSSQAIEEMAQGERLEVLLIDGTHLEALLAGVTTPSELFGALLDHASYRGTPNPELGALLARSSEPSELEWETPAPLETLIREGERRIAAEVFVAALPFGQLGVLATTATDVTVVTGVGVLRLDPRQRSVEAVPSPGMTSLSPVQNRKGDLLVSRGVAQGIWNLTRSSAVGLAGPGGVRPVRGLADDIWALSNGSEARGEGAAITQLGAAPGEERTTLLPYKPSTVRNAVWLTPDELLVATTGGISTWRPGEEPAMVTDAITNPMGLVRIDDQRAFVVGNAVRLYEIHVGHRRVREMAHFNLQPSVTELCAIPESDRVLLLASHYQDEEGRTHGVVIRVQLLT